MTIVETRNEIIRLKSLKPQTQEIKKQIQKLQQSLDNA